MRRRALGEAGEALTRVGGSISTSEALSEPPLLVVKLVCTGLAQVFPEKPSFSQLETLDPATARALDAADFARSADDATSAFSRALYAYYWKYGPAVSPGGVVYVWPGVMGQDP